MSTNPNATQQMQRLRAALIDDIRSNTAATSRGTRKMLLLAMPNGDLKKKLAACRAEETRKGASRSRYLCEHPACPLCMWKKSRDHFKRVLWPALAHVPPTRLRWVTVLTNTWPDLDDGAREATRQHRRLQHALKLAATDRRHPGVIVPIHVWGCREVEKDGAKWVFHVHMLVDVFTLTPDELGTALRAAWPAPRAVMIKTLTDRDHQINIKRLAAYMMKARYTVSGPERREWMDLPDIAAVAAWRDRMPAQWHRWCWGVKREQDVGRFFTVRQ